MVENMINSIIERRVAHADGPHRIELQINEKQFEDLYDDLDEGSAEDMVRIYLDSKGDDGRPENIIFKFDKNQHIIRVMADLRYVGNEHTEYINRHRDSTFD